MRAASSPAGLLLNSRLFFMFRIIHYYISANKVPDSKRIFPSLEQIAFFSHRKHTGAKSSRFFGMCTDNKKDSKTSVRKLGKGDIRHLAGPRTGKDRRGSKNRTKQPPQYAAAGR